MKKFAVLILLSLQFVAALAFADNTQIRITPPWTANCLAHNYPHLNQVGQIEKISEDSEQVTFQFVLRYFSCEDIVETPYNMNSDLVALRIDKTNNIKLIFQSDNTELLTQVTFNKTKLFKLNKSISEQKNTRKLLMFFYPYGIGPVFQYHMTDPRYVPRKHFLEGMTFTWNVVLTRNSSDKTSIELIKQ